MSKITTGQELAQAVLAIAKNHKTLYVYGCWGAPMTESNKKRWLEAQSYNRKATRKAKIQAAGADVFGFDCVNMIKGLFWGWAGDASQVYGGAGYDINGVPDISADGMIKACHDVSKDFSSIQPGEAVWIPGHIGVYIGDGLVVECTPNWKDGVQVTAALNFGKKAGYNGRKWTKHGKLPYITYPAAPEAKKEVFTLEMRTLKKGSRGEDVRALQILLKGRGHNGKMGAPDGIFGPNTEGAVKSYQKAKGLSVDGIAGPKTLTSLLGV